MQEHAVHHVGFSVIVGMFKTNELSNILFNNIFKLKVTLTAFVFCRYTFAKLESFCFRNSNTRAEVKAFVLSAIVNTKGI